MGIETFRDGYPLIRAGRFKQGAECGNCRFNSLRRNSRLDLRKHRFGCRVAHCIIVVIPPRLGWLVAGQRFCRPRPGVSQSQVLKVRPSPSGGTTVLGGGLDPLDYAEKCLPRLLVATFDQSSHKPSVDHSREQTRSVGKLLTADSAPACVA